MWFEPDDVEELVQIGGLIRFSMPTDGGFQKNPVSHAEKLAKLYAPARLEQRFAYFETFCLPTLKNQTDPNFRVGLLVGVDMPALYRQRLEALLADVPQAVIIEKPIMDHRQAIEQAYNEVFDRKTPLRLSFRLDDDDALAVDYIAEVRAKLPVLLMLSGGLDLNPVCLTFSQGLTLHGPSDDRQLVAAYERSPISAGLAVLAPADAKPLVMMVPHMRIQMDMRTIVDPGPMMNLRTLHTSNDSRGKLHPALRFELSEADLRAVLAARFKLNLDDVLAV